MSSYSSFLSSNSENDQPDEELVDIASYLNFDEVFQEASTYHQTPSFRHMNGDFDSRSDTGSNINAATSSSRKSGFKIAFRTKSEHEIIDDGYKWRKYGKKMVKNSPNPRNYFRCSSVGCNVKKRVQREREDSSYVITTYEGVHNHHVFSPVAAHHHTSGSAHADAFSGNTGVTAFRSSY